MSSTEHETDSLHNRTLSGVDEVISRALNYVHGLEKVLVNRAVEILRPKVEQRIRLAAEENLRAELRYLHDLLGSILQEPSPQKTTRPKIKTKRKRKT